MDYDTEMLLKVARAQAWERAKGEMRAVAASFVTKHGTRERDRSMQFMELQEAFVKTVDDEGLVE